MDRNQIKDLITAKYVSMLAVTEAGVGALLHSFRIPLAGHFLSLNQGFLLQLSSRQHCKEISKSRVSIAFFIVQLSTLGALFKALSPAGKRLTPMIAISIQGCFFSLGVLLFGTSNVALGLSLALMSLWAFFQSLLFAWMFFGSQLFEAFFWATEKLSFKMGLPKDSALGVFALAIFVKLVVAFCIGYFGDSKRLQQFSFFLGNKGKKVLQSSSLNKKKHSSPLVGALKDLCSPLMLVSFALLAIFFTYSTFYTPTQKIWTLLRVVCVSLSFFFVIRVFPVDRMLKFIQAKNPRLASLLNHVSKNLKDCPEN